MNPLHCIFTFIVRKSVKCVYTRTLSYINGEIWGALGAWQLSHAHFVTVSRRWHHHVSFTLAILWLLSCHFAFKLLLSL